MGFERILIPFDGTELAKSVLDAGIATAGWAGADVVLMFVEREGVALDDPETNAQLDAVERDAEALMALAMPYLTQHDVSPDRVTSDVRAGPVADVIVEAVEELLCDMVVMGSHGRSGIVEAVTGSTTERVVRRTPASVFIVRPKGYPYLRD
jgi:nucleotide-binding universal stress UspA family protein